MAIQCDNKGAKVALITTSGGRDNTIPFMGGSRRKRCLPSDPHFMTTWAERNGLPSTNESTMLESTDIEHYSFGQGDAAGMVQSYYIPSMGHQWPNGNAKSHISGTKIFMDFFADWNMTRKNSIGKSLPTSTYNITAAETGAAALVSVSNYQGLGLLMALLGSMVMF